MKKKGKERVRIEMSTKTVKKKLEDDDLRE